jgi:uncharacterized RDD family membrane protein YckC
MGLWFIVTFFGLLVFNFHQIIEPLLLQFILWISSGIYFILSWVFGGQTLAMRAWKLKLIAPYENWWFYYVRYLLISIGIIFFFIPFIWAIFNKENQFLHDLILGSEIKDVRF